MGSTTKASRVLQTKADLCLVLVAENQLCATCPGGDECDTAELAPCAAKVWAKNPRGLGIGDRGGLVFEDSSQKLIASLILFGAPIAGFLAGLLGYGIFSRGRSEVWLLGAGGLGFVVGCLVSFLASRWSNLRPSIVPAAEIPEPST